MKLLGSITRQMYHAQEKTFTTPEMKTYTVPLDGSYMGIDVGRQVYLTDAGLVVLESYRDKKLRELKVWTYEKEQGIPIQNPNNEVH